MAEQKIIPNIWCDTNADEVVAFYLSVFPDGELLGRSPYPTEGLPDFQRAMAGQDLVVDFAIGGFRVTAINAGSEFTPNPSISFMVNLDPSRDPRAESRIDELWGPLSDQGQVLMPLEAYPFSPRYGWVQDRFGVSWQLMVTDPAGEPRPFLIPSLLFANHNANRASEAIEFYTSVFPDARTGTLARHPQALGEARAGALMFGEFAVGEEWIMAMDSPVRHAFDFAEGMSLLVECADQAEVDYFWDRLSRVPEAEACGWCKDQFGVSWQVVPRGMTDLLDRPGNYAAVMAMKKIDLATLSR